MDRAGIDRLEHLLSRKGETISAILLLIPLAVELAVRYGLGTGALLWLCLTLLYGLLQFMRHRTKLSPKFDFILIILNYFVSFAILVWLLSLPLSPLIFLGVMISTFVAYVFSSRGVLWSINIFSLIIVVIFWLQHGGQVDALSFSQLLSTVAMMALLIDFCSELISLNQGEIVELNETYSKLRAEHLRLVSLVNTLGDAVIATDSDGNIQTYNGAALELLDTNASLTGKAIDEIWHLTDAEHRPVKLIDEARRINTSFRRSDLIITYGNNDQANLYVNVTPLKIGYGKEAQQGFTLIMRDITKEKSLDEERDEFISVVSHELRTPVTITEGKISNAQLLLDKPKEAAAKLKESLQAAHDQVVFLANMINDLSALARAEREDAELDLKKSIRPSWLTVYLNHMNRKSSKKA
jgi:PAS domain S-box-containing protein